MEFCIQDVRLWMIRNKLKINDDTTEFLIVSSSHSHVQLQESLTIGHNTISSSSSCRNLSVMFDHHADMGKQVSRVCRSTHFHLRNIGMIRQLLTDTAAAQHVHSWLTSRLDYCNSLLYKLPNRKIKRLQRIQNIACRIVCLAPKEIDISPKMKNLHWLPFWERIQSRFCSWPLKL